MANEQNPIRSIAIIGGGTAGWSVAAQLSRVLQGGGVKITLVESSDIPTVGVGEATIPPIFEYLGNAGINEVEFIRECDATFKLAIKFEDWLTRGASYWHPFGTFGMTINQRPFHHYWWRDDVRGGGYALRDFCPAIALAEQNKFAFPPPTQSFPGSGLTFALHFDAGKVATYLAALSQRRGVKRLIQTINGCTRADDGRIAALQLANGEQLAADLFIDCSGFVGLLIEKELEAGYADWTHWLPCDRAVAVPSESATGRTPYTISTALEAGWKWRIPLQGRNGNGYVFSSQFITTETATARLLAALDTAPLAEPRALSFTAGHRRKFWSHNVVAVGLAAGFLEPLESTSIHLIHTAINRLLDYWPDRNFNTRLAEAFNRETAAEYAHIRDFLLLHYYPNKRHGEPFWDAVRNVVRPDSLIEKVAMLKENGRILSRQPQLFADISWFFVAHGMGLSAANHDPLAELPTRSDIAPILKQMRDAMRQWTAAAPHHDALLQRMLDPNEKRKPDFSVLRQR